MLLFFGFSFELSAYERGAWQKHETALALFNAGQFERALRLLQEVNSVLPENLAVRKNLVMAALGAGQQQLHAGNYLHAAELLQIGKGVDGQESRLWLLRGIALLKSSRLGEAEAELNEAWAISGDEPQVLQHLGQLYYLTDRMEDAVNAWQRSLALAPDNFSLQRQLEKVQRELVVENELSRNYSGHFILSYADAGQSDVSGDILDALEEAYTWVGSHLHHYSESRTLVILYTREQFQGLTDSPGWATGLYDGKIRLSIGGLTQIDAPVKALLAHEFMHVAVHELAGKHVPVWLNEGLAEIAARQWEDPSSAIAVPDLENQALFPLTELNGSFRDIDAHKIHLAYAQSADFVAYLIARFGWYPFSELLPLFKSGLSAAQAFDKVYGDYAVSLASLEADWRRQL
jgi:tetratricopeptide (TPR) repeat protein